MVSWNAGALAGRTFLDVSLLREWPRIREGGGRGPASARSRRTRTCCATRWCDAACPLLAEACATVGGVQIQNRGTLGGNIANASPAGDTFPPLAVYEAVVVAASSRRAAGARSRSRTSSPGRSARASRRAS